MDDAGQILLAGTEHVQRVEEGEALSKHSALTQTRSREHHPTLIAPWAPQDWSLEKTRSALQPNLLFVTYTSPSDLESRNIKDVRSHVMRQHIRRRRARAEEAEAEAEVGSSEQALTEVKRPRIEFLTGQGRVDPFRTLSFTMTKAMSRLFDHYATALSPLHYPPSRNPTRNPMTTRWVPMAIKDPALLHSTICSAGGHLTLLEGTIGAESSEYLTHKAETIRVINERMTGLSQAMTDETLGAIALLVTDQVVDGDYKEMCVHMKGLAKLVNLRGGLPALGMNGLLAGEIQWCDTVTAFVTSSPPLLPLNQTSGSPDEAFASSIFRQYLLSELSVQSFHAALQENSISKLLSEDLIGIFWDMSTLTAILNLKPDLSETDMLLYDRKRASIQHRLASLLISPTLSRNIESETQHETKVYVQESIRMTGVLYSIMTLWGFQPPMHFFGDLAITLQKSLLWTDLETFWGGDIWEDILVWILILGGYAALNRPERAWFVDVLVKVSSKRGFTGFADVKIVLSRVLYQESLEKPLKELWKVVNESMLQRNRVLIE